MFKNVSRVMDGTHNIPGYISLGPDQNYVPSYAFMQNKISLSHRVLSITSSTLTLIAFIEKKKRERKYWR